ncbi:MAG: hypothetical protein QG585_552 [Patescibacteria group bacterium]|jgi:hypothetical protein|nr:hypothetical protein [Patescibacteria group bacterium]
MKISFFLLTIFIFLGSFFVVNAQSIPSEVSGLEEQVYIKTTPQTPGPNEDVEILLEAYGTDLNRAKITWKVNGAVVKSGVGDRKLSLKSGNSGKLTVVIATIQPIEGFEITKRVEIFPGEVDLIWETDTYTPPFYKGKSWFTSQSNITVSAIPNIIEGGVRGSTANTIYKWSKNNTVLGSESGFGKKTFKFKDSILLNDEIIGVEAESASGKKAKAEVVLFERNPQAVLYEENASLGVLFNKAIVNNYNFDSEEKNILVYPYFFSTESKDGASMKYVWSQNDEEIFLPQEQSNLILKNTEGTSGKSKVSVRVNSLVNIVQESRVGAFFNFSSPKKNFEF